MALEQLRAHPLIRSISRTQFYPYTTVAPGLYDVEFAPAIGPLQTAQMLLETQAGSDIVESILLFDTGLQLSDIALTVGQPASIILEDQFHIGFVTYVGFYPQYQMHIRTVMAVCSLEGHMLWIGRQGISVGIETEQRYAEQPSYYSADAHQNGTGWLHRLYSMKKAARV